MQKYLNQLVEMLIRIKSAEEMKDFLKALLTPQELEIIPKRLEVIKLLKKGSSQRLIASRLNVGIATVTRGARELKLNHFRNV